MENKVLIEKIHAYCDAAGISPSTLGVRVLGNSRFLDRLKRRVERDEEAAQRIITYMADHPVGEKTEGAQP